MRVITIVVLLSFAADARASCTVTVEGRDEQGSALPAITVQLRGEVCQYQSQELHTDEHGLVRIQGVPSDCRFIAKGQFPGCIIHPISGTCGASDEVVRLTCIEPRHVSLLRVLANPEEFDGLYVTLTGVLFRHFEGDALYVDLGSLKNHVTKNAIYLHLRPDQWQSMQRSSKQYVTLTGRFNAKSLGHMGAYSGSLEEIE